MLSSNPPSLRSCPSLPWINTSYCTPDFSLSASLRSVSMPAVYSALCPSAHCKRCCSACCFQSIAGSPLDTLRNAAFPMPVSAYPVHQNRSLRKPVMGDSSLPIPGQLWSSTGLPSVLSLILSMLFQLYPGLWHLPGTSASAHYPSFLVPPHSGISQKTHPSDRELGPKSNSTPHCLL